MTASSVSVVQSRRSPPRGVIIAVLSLASLALLAAPAFLPPGDLRFLIEVLTIFTFAQTWNLLAGYAGLMSFGHQLFIGLGAYFLFVVSNATGINPFLLLPLSAVFSGLCAALISPLLFRLRDAYFAIGLWVLAEVVRLFTIRTEALGSVSGLSLTATRQMDRMWVTYGNYWAAAVLAILSVVGLYIFLQCRAGFALVAVRDNEQAATAVGINVGRTRLIGFVLASALCGASGAVYYMSIFYIDPGSVYDPNWVVIVLFIVIIGGVGTIEGPIIGTLIYFVLRGLLAETGYIYMMVLGVAAVAVMLIAPKGLWGELQSRLNFSALSSRREG